MQVSGRLDGLKSVLYASVWVWALAIASANEGATAEAQASVDEVQASTEETAEETATEPSLALETFEEVWQTVADSYWDPDFGGLDWEAIGARYRPEAEAAEDPDQLREVLNAMLSELGESHFGVVPGTEDLVAEAMVDEPIGDPGEEKEKDEEKESPGEPEEPEPTADVVEESDLPPVGSYSGLHLRLLGQNRVAIAKVDADSPAMKAGLRAGHIVLRVGDLEIERLLERMEEVTIPAFSQEYYVLEVLDHFIGSVPEDEEQQTLTVRSPLRGAEESVHAYRPVDYPGRMSVAVANMPEMPLVYEEERLAVDSGHVLGIHFNVFLPELMTELRASVAKARSEGAVGLIIDLRGNPGGIGMMANGLAGLLTEDQFSLGTMTMRAGAMNFIAFPQREAYLGPVAILVDGMSASTSEIFAAGLQERGRARVFGRRSMGAALPSFFRDLPNGDRLQHAIADLRTEGGVRLEGEGVKPDVRVGLKPRKRFRGQDPDVNRALKWLGSLEKSGESSDAEEEVSPATEPNRE